MYGGYPVTTLLKPNKGLVGSGDTYDSYQDKTKSPNYFSPCIFLILRIKEVPEKINSQRNDKGKTNEYMKQE